MGADKARLVVDDAPWSLGQRSGSILLEACPLAVEVGPGVSGLARVADETPGAGPLAAMVTGHRWLVERGHEGPVLVLAVDLPFITAAALTIIVDHPTRASVVPVVDGRAQVLCARWSPDALDEASRLLATGVRSMRALLERVSWTALRESAFAPVGGAMVLADVDTPADLSRLGLHAEVTP